MSTPSHFSQFSMDHWLKVSAERRRQGLGVHPGRGQLQPNHPLVGLTLVDTTDSRTYVVERVRKDWMQGWFLTAMLNHNGSHRLVMVESLGCADKGILAQLDIFENTFKVVQ